MAKVQNQKSQVVSSKEMNEMDYLNDVLQCEKNISNNYSIAIDEMSNKILFQSHLCTMKPRSPKRVNNSLTSAVAWKLKQLRVAKGFSQEYVKENTGVNIQRSESSTTTVSLITLDILCKFYGTSLKEFFNELDQ